MKHRILSAAFAVAAILPGAQAASQDGDEMVAIYAEAQAAHEAGDFVRANELAGQLGKMSPDGPIPSVHNLMMKKALETGDMDQAREAFDALRQRSVSPAIARDLRRYSSLFADSAPVQDSEARDRLRAEHGEQRAASDLALVNWSANFARSLADAEGRLRVRAGRIAQEA